MSLQQLQGPTTQNGPMLLHNGMFQPGPGMSLGQPLGTGNLAGILQPSPPSVGPYPPSGIASVGGQLPPLTSIISGPGRPIFDRPMPLPQPIMPDYSGQFEKFGEQLGGFGEQLTGYGDALGTFNEQVGGMGKQFETISNRLDSVDKGLGSLGNQIASLENMQKAQPQEVMQPQSMPQQPMYSPFGFGLGALFGRRFF